MITRGFQGRRSQSESKRVPPGQHSTRDFPVLSRTVASILSRVRNPRSVDAHEY
jgi:hypothetical protein